MIAESPVWVFGYGSLVSPASIATTVGREVVPGDGFRPATLDGFGRRWNYGSLRQRADWTGSIGAVQAGIVVSLGIEEAPGEWANGSIVRVSSKELAMLDRRESDYDRVDVSDRIGSSAPETVVTYVPRRSAIDRYRQARDDHRAAVRSGYVELVEGAFAALGGTELADYERTTPRPQVPIVEFESVWLED